MIALYIIAAVVGVFALLLWWRAGVIFAFDGENIELTVRYGPFRIRIMPKKPKKIKLSDYSYKKTHKKKKKKKEEPEPKKKTKAKKKKKTEPTEGEAEKKEGGINVLGLLLDLRGAILDVLKRFPKKLRLVIYRLRITVATDNAASTAITYGEVTQGVGAALTLAQAKADVRVKDDAVMIAYDFLSDKITADVKLSLSIRVGSVVYIGLRFVFNFIKVFLSQRKKSK